MQRAKPVSPGFATAAFTVPGLGGSPSGDHCRHPPWAQPAVVRHNRLHERRARPGRPGRPSRSTSAGCSTPRSADAASDLRRRCAEPPSTRLPSRRPTPLPPTRLESVLGPLGAARAWLAATHPAGRPVTHPGDLRRRPQVPGTTSGPPPPVASARCGPPSRPVGRSRRPAQPAPRRRTPSSRGRPPGYPAGSAGHAAATRLRRLPGRAPPRHRGLGPDHQPHRRRRVCRPAGSVGRPTSARGHALRSRRGPAGVPWSRWRRSPRWSQRVSAACSVAGSGATGRVDFGSLDRTPSSIPSAGAGSTVPAPGLDRQHRGQRPAERRDHQGRRGRRRRHRLGLRPRPRRPHHHQQPRRRECRQRRHDQGRAVQRHRDRRDDRRSRRRPTTWPSSRPTAPTSCRW